MKKFKRFLCIPLLVLFTMTLLTLPAAAAVTVLLPDGKPAASMTFAMTANSEDTYRNYAQISSQRINITTDANGVAAWPSGFLYKCQKDTGLSSFYIILSTVTPSQMIGKEHLTTFHPDYNPPLQIKLERGILPKR